MVSSNEKDEDDDIAFSGNNEEGAIITRARHRQHVEAAVEALYRFDELSQHGAMAVDMAAEELRLATSELGRITGAVDVEEVLDVLFTDFCIGK
jgi:tRNA modification GTPase